MEITLPLNRLRMAAACMLLAALFHSVPARSQNSGMKDTYVSLPQLAEKTARQLSVKLRLTAAQTGEIRKATLNWLRKLKSFRDHPESPGAEVLKQDAAHSLDSAYRRILTPSQYGQLMGPPGKDP